jgi:PadR family transcriptional regulator PadR
MHPPAAKNPAFMSGVPELVVLRLLAQREMYGYEIARLIRTLTNDSLSLGEGVLYPALHAMEQRGLVRSRSVAAEGRIRIYYRLSARGHARLSRLTAEWQRLRTGIEGILGAADHG